MEINGKSEDEMKRKRFIEIPLFAFAAVFCLSLVFAKGVGAKAKVCEPEETSITDSEVLYESAENQTSEIAEYELHEEYIVSGAGSELTLSRYENGVPTVVCRGRLSEIFSAISGGRVVFDGVTADGGAIVPSGKFTLSGVLSVGGTVTVSEGCELLFSELTLNHFGEGAALRIKGGALTIEDSIIDSEQGFVLLDYSAASTLILKNGEIISRRAEFALEIRLGAAYILGGAVEACLGTGIFCDSSLIIGGGRVLGAEYGIKTKRAIKIHESGLGEHITVCIDESPREGELTKLFYSAKAADADKLDLYDASGKKYSLTYFESYNGIDERNFLAVYLPFTVRYFCEGELYGEERRLKGEEPELVAPPELLGYSFAGWYHMGKPLQTNFKIEGNTDLSGEFELIPPTVNASGFRTEYDGNSHMLSVAVNHPLEGLGGSYLFEWYKNGELISRAESLSLCGVLDSGEYECRITFYHKTKSVRLWVRGITAEILPQKIALPKVMPKQYNGNHQTSGIESCLFYTVDELGGVNTGVYSVRLELVDKENYQFPSGGAFAEVFFEIIKAQNRWTTPPKIYNAYLGQELKAEGEAQFGAPVYRFSKEIDGEYSAEPPRAIGKYYVIAEVPETENYTKLVSAPAAFEILEERVVALEIISNPSKLSYIAFEHFTAAGLRAAAIYNSGREEELSADALTIRYQTAESFRFGDNGIILSYGGASVTVPVSVFRATYDISGIVFADTEEIFSGEHITPSPGQMEIIGMDGLPLTYKISGGGRDVGKYTVTLIFETSSTNYTLPSPITATLEILPLAVEIIWEVPAFIYDGGEKAPAAYYIDAKGIRRAAEVTGGASEAGEGYIASANIVDKNYLAKNDEISFDIEKAAYDLSGVGWVQDSFVYSGEIHKVAINGVPEGITVVGYTNGEATDAGHYTAEAIFIYDENNYHKPKLPSLLWEITPAEYDMSGISVESVSVEFDGNMHYPKINGELPIGHDGSVPRIVISHGATHVSDGEVVVTVSFVSDSKNYLNPKSIEGTVRILPKVITFSWSEFDLTYCGAAQAPIAETPLCNVSVSGAATDAGEYTAYAISEDADYFISNSEKTFIIKKAENFWVSPPKVESIYESGELLPRAEAHFGEASFRYYFDEACTKPCESPKTHGVYYAVCEISESKNYLPLASKPLRFEIIEVLSVGISVKLQAAEWRAYERILPSDITVTVKYNDGTSLTVDCEPQIVYENGETLLARDIFFTVSYLGHTERVPIEVKKAVYDLSRVTWQNTVTVYNGEPWAPGLSGLPRGVFVKSYNLAPVVNAGTYLFSAELSYDEENYEMPLIPSCEFTVKKCIVSSPEEIELVYSGEQYEITSDNPLYTIEENKIKNAGKYTLTAKISDKANYEFEGGAASLNFEATVLPIKLLYSLPNYEVYLFDELPSITPELIRGEILEGERISYLTHIENGRIILRSQNPNYEITVDGGEIIRYNYPSAERVGRILILVIAILIILLMLVLSVLWRRRIIAAIFVKRDSGDDSLGNSFGNGKVKADFITEKEEPHSERGAESEGEQVPECEQNRSEELDKSEEFDKSDKMNDLTETLDSKGLCNFAEEDIPQEQRDVNERGNSHESDSAVADGITAEQGVNMDKADSLITDSLAKDLIKKGRENIITSGRGQGIINVDTLSASFEIGSRVDINILKQKNLVPYDTAYLKVLARGIIDKPLQVYANEFSLSAVKMIALTGGEAIRVNTVVKKDGHQG